MSGPATDAPPSGRRILIDHVRSREFTGVRAECFGVSKWLAPDEARAVALFLAAHPAGLNAAECDDVARALLRAADGAQGRG